MHVGKQERGRRRMPVALMMALLIAVAFGVRTVTDPPVAAALTNTPWITVLCKFRDVTAEPKKAAYFDGLMGSTYPGMDHYWRQVSYNAINLAGSRTTTRWYTLPLPRSAYEPWNATLNQLFYDCTAAADRDVNYAAYYGINLMFNADGKSGALLTKGHRRVATLDGVQRTWGVTYLSSGRFIQQAAVAHEMGHGYGLAHSSTAAVAGGTGNRWDIMSSPACTYPGGYDCVGPHPIAYHKMLKGWLPPGKIFEPPSNLGTWEITLDNLASQTASNYLMARIPVSGAWPQQQLYTVEARLGTGDYENALAPAAVIVHEVDSTRAGAAWVIDTDNNANTLDVGARFVVGETFTAPTGPISVTVKSRVPTGFTVVINVLTPPSNLRAGRVTEDSIQILWNDTTTGEAFFDVQWQEQGTAWYLANPAPVANRTSWTAYNLTALTRYEFQVRACVAMDVCSSWTPIRTFRTEASVCPTGYCP